MDKKLWRRHGLVLLAGSALYAFLYAFCSQIDQKGATSPGAAWPRFVLALPVACIALGLLFRYVLPLFDMKRRGEEKPFNVYGAMVLIFCCYVPVFLIHYPGSFQYDSSAEVAQIAGGIYNQMHPVLHTLLVRFCISFYDLFQSMEKCAALLSLIQMALVSGCFAGVCASLSRSVSRRAARISLAFFCLYPAHWAFASNCTKDVLFAAFLALFLALCMEEIQTKTLCAKLRAVQIVSGVLTLLLRNNVIFALVPWLIVLLVCGKRYRRMALCAALVIALGQGTNAALIALVDAQGGRLTEGLSLPIQQLARARIYAPECFSPEETALLDTLFVPEELADVPDAFYERYDPVLADPVKNGVNHDIIADNLSAFFGLWRDIGKKAPRIYADAFFNLALPSLYPYSAYRLPARYIEVGCNLAMTVHYALAPIVQPRRFESARAWLDDVFFLTGADDHPVLRWLFNTGFVYWVMLLFVLYDAYKGNRSRIAVLMLPVFFWITYLLGPIMQGRYLYPFICMLPVMVFRFKTEIHNGR